MRNRRKVRAGLELAQTIAQSPAVPCSGAESEGLEKVRPRGQRGLFG